jgi:hypothetical protein
VRERRVRFTVTAQRHIDRERRWWLENRDHREIFAAELEETVKLLALLPGLALCTRTPGLPTCGDSTFGSSLATSTTFDDERSLSD